MLAYDKIGSLIDLHIMLAWLGFSGPPEDGISGIMQLNKGWNEGLNLKLPEVEEAMHVLERELWAVHDRGVRRLAKTLEKLVETE